LQSNLEGKEEGKASKEVKEQEEEEG